jgi:hypothetical protein
MYVVVTGAPPSAASCELWENNSTDDSVYGSDEFSLSVEIPTSVGLFHLGSVLLSKFSKYKLKAIGFGFTASLMGVPQLPEIVGDALEGDVTKAGDNVFTGENTFEGNVNSGPLDFVSGTSIPTIDGQLRYLSGITGLSGKQFAYFDVAVKYFLSYDTLPTVDGVVLTYNADNDDFDWAVPSAGTIADNSISAIKMNSTNSPADNQVQSYDEATGGYTWVDQADGAPPTIQAADPTSASSVGWHCALTSGHTFYKSAEGLFNVSTGEYTADPSAAPTLVSATIPTSGDTITLVFSENVEAGSGGSAGFTLSTPTDVMTYSSGDGTDTIVFTLASTINSGDTPTIGYTQPTDGWEATTGGVDVESFSGSSVVNNSTQESSSTLTAFIAGSEDDGDPLSTGSGTVSITGMTHAEDHDSGADGALLNDGADDYFDIQTSGNIDYGVGKISFYLYPEQSQTSRQYRYLFSDAADYHAFCLLHEADDRLRFRTTDGSAYFDAAVSTDLLTQDTWHLIEFTWSDVANEVTLRINGGTVQTAAITFSGATEGTNFRFTAGSAAGATSYYGRIDTVSIFSTTTEA